MRVVTHRYEDPLSRIWISCAERMGLRVARDPSAYASTDGQGTMFIATDEHLDGDDSLAQMIFHEICHSLVEGPEAFTKVDWGLDNIGPDDIVREHACLRLQALLTRPLGLAGVFAPTTDFRTFWDALGPDPLLPEGDPSVPLARLAMTRVKREPWNPHLERALHATAAIAESVAALSDFRSASDSLWARVEPKRPPHPSGLPSAAEGTRAHRESCGSCAWAHMRRGQLHCHKTRARVRAEFAACERWEGPLDCQACAACCREAFDTVLVGKREPLVRKYPSLVVLTNETYEIPRAGKCPLLSGEGRDEAPYSCDAYEVRPRSCREFERGSANCLFARERVGLSF
jgi:hypothetical protein